MHAAYPVKEIPLAGAKPGLSRRSTLERCLSGRIPLDGPMRFRADAALATVRAALELTLFTQAFATILAPTHVGEPSH